MKSTNFFEISNSNRELSMNICRKFYNAVEFYANKSESVEIESKLLDQAASVLTKFLSAGVNLEFLWQIHYAKDQINLETPPHTTEWENSVSFTDLIFMDNFIMQAKSFLDHTKNLTLITLEVHEKWTTRHQFENLIRTKETEKANLVYDLYTNIYEQEKWGYDLNKIRNKLSHNEIHKTDSEFKPKINQKEFQRFCQDIGNNMFEFLQKLQEILFEQKWVAG